jgi:hypothetical protein
MRGVDPLDDEFDRMPDAHAPRPSVSKWRWHMILSAHTRANDEEQTEEKKEHDG